jgi:uncharacterized membrane protein YphA (DoxX/SURF4 family)
MTDLNLLAFRLLVGFFFVLYRFRWVYDPALPGAAIHWSRSRTYYAPTQRWFNEHRHRKLEQKLMQCGYAPQLAGPVAIVELLAGLALIVGLLSQLAALGLFIILIAATIKTAKEKVALQKPVDLIDHISCYLWLSEPLYIALCFAILTMGPGAYSLDAVFGLIF